MLMRPAVLAALVAAVSTPLGAQAPAQPQIPAKPAPVERLGPDTLRMGQVRIDTAKREVTVPGTVNDVPVLEFVANTKSREKAYESALTLDTDGVTINTALILIGLDPAHAVAPAMHFDAAAPKGDPVEIWVEWTDAHGKPRRIPAEELVFNASTNQTLPRGPWVYLGSGFNEAGYLADQIGVIVSFAHTPAAIIEHPSPAGVGNYGAWKLNPALSLRGDAPVTVTIRALPSPARK